MSFIEEKLIANGVAKVVPLQEQLVESYRAFMRGKRIEEIVEKALKDYDDDEIAVPDDLQDRVRRYLAEKPTDAWDAALRSAVEDDFSTSDDDGEP